jgi:hypothetical protein
MIEKRDHGLIFGTNADFTAETTRVWHKGDILYVTDIHTLAFGDGTNLYSALKSVQLNGQKQIPVIAPLAGDVVPADISAKLDALILAMKTAKLMASS